MEKGITIYIYKKLFALLLVSTLLGTCMSCTATTQPLTYTGYYFDTIVSLTFYNATDATLAEDCFALCETYENMLSRTVEGSDIWNINHSNGSPVSVNEETYALIEEALFYCELTDGKIDITIAPLMEQWSFTDVSNVQTPPSEEKIDELLPLVDYHFITMESNCITLQKSDVSLDLGFIAKGYIADKIKDFLISQGVASALINLGGNVSAIGTKPDGSCYNIGIQKPFSPSGTSIETVCVSDASVVTSGIYERYYMYDGTVMHHILDATTGYPAENTLTSVTIIAPSATQADALSTTCFVLGPEKALDYINSLKDVTCILICEDESIYYSDNAK